MSFDPRYYLHPSDKAALKALKAIPGFHQLIKAYLKVWSERQSKILNMSGKIRINDNQLDKYYNMLPPICEKLGIDIPELYLSLDVVPNSYTAGDTKPYIVMTSGLFETLPEELIPTVLAHECGHIACHHALYTTVGQALLNASSFALYNFVPFGLGYYTTLPILVAFFYWMRCSEYSADRAAVLCDGSSEKMAEVCMRLAGFDKDIDAIVNKNEFIQQAQEYRDMINNSKWDKTLEFLILSRVTHPLMTVRTLECEEWGNSEQFKSILEGTYILPEDIKKEEDAEILEDDTSEPNLEGEENTETRQSGRAKGKFELPKFQNIFNRSKEQNIASEEDGKEAKAIMSIPDEIRKYKELMDEGIISKEEFEMKKTQLLNM